MTLDENDLAHVVTIKRDGDGEPIGEVVLRMEGDTCPWKSPSLKSCIFEGRISSVDMVRKLVSGPGQNLGDHCVYPIAKYTIEAIRKFHLVKDIEVSSRTQELRWNGIDLIE